MSVATAQDWANFREWLNSIHAPSWVHDVVDDIASSTSRRADDMARIAEDLRTALKVDGDALFLASYARGWIEARRDERARAAQALGLAEPTSPVSDESREAMAWRLAEDFCELDTEQMARVIAAASVRGEQLDREGRAKPWNERRTWLGFDWFMWPEVGKAIADLDMDEGERARAFVLQVYDGMIRRMQERLGDWRRSVPDGSLIEECARERGAIR